MGPSNKTAVLRLATAIMAAVGTAAALAAAKAKVKARGKAKEEGTTTIMAEETKEVMRITEMAPILEIIAAVRADAAKAVLNSLSARRSTIRRRKLSSAAR